MRKRILSIWLSVCMILTMLPISAMAEEAGISIDASGEIIVFAPLAETEKSVPTGTSIEELGLPDSLAATVRKAVITDNSTAEEPVRDSGSPEAGSVSDNLMVVPPGAAIGAETNGQRDTGEATEPEWQETTLDIPVTWTSEYDMDTEGVYVFTPVIEGYTVSADLPEITVTVGAQPRMMPRMDTSAAYGDLSVPIDTPLKIEVLSIYGNPPVDEMLLPSHGFTQPTDGSKTADLYWDSGKINPITYGDTNYSIYSGFQDTIYFYATEPGTYIFTATFIDDDTHSDYPITVIVTNGNTALSTTKSIADSSLYFRADGGETQYSTDGSTWTSYTGDFTIEGSSTSDTDAAHTVIVQSGTHNIILSDCSIGAATDTGEYVSAALSPFDIQGGTVNLTLTGSNKLYSAHVEKAALRVAVTASLVITEDSTGSLDARCHKARTTGDNLFGAGAGIGGNSSNEEISGAITINGGTVVAQSGDGNGIGHGKNSFNFGETVTINGGSVNASSIFNTPKNSLETAVQLYTLTLSGVSPATAVTTLSTTPEIGYTYGTTGMKTDEGGKLYVYLPAGKTGASVITAAAKTYTNDSFTGNTATLYSGYAVSGTIDAGMTNANVSGLTVNLYESSDTTFSASLGSATTDTNGAYTISHVENGSYVARVAGTSGSYAVSVSGTITVSGGGVNGADITLTALATQSIAVKPGAQKTAYKVGDSLDVTNLYITVTCSDNSTYDRSVLASWVTGFNSSAVAASQTLTVTFDGKTATCTISVSRADYSGSAAPTPELVSKTDTQAVISAVTVSGQTVEYGKNTSDTTPTVWQDGTTFTELTAGTVYYFFARVKQTDTVEAGGVSSALAVTTKTAPAGAPAAPTIGTGENRPTSSNITISTMVGNEYYISTSTTANWSGTPGGYFKADETVIHEFEGLSSATQYYIYARVAETDDAMPSASACATQYTLPVTPLASVVTVNFTAETISFANAYEVSGNENFTATISPGGAIQPGTTYYVRVTAASGIPASEALSFTIPARPTAPGAVTAENITKTDTTITVAATVATQEYSVDGGVTWQAGNDSSLTFNGLSANHAYSVVTRSSATTTAFASTSSTVLSITTKASAAAAPAYAIDFINEKTTVPVPSTTEYNTTSADAETWMTGTGETLTLTPGITYYFRTAATDDALAGNAQTLVVPARPAAPSTSAVSIAAGNDESHTKLTLADTYEYILAAASPAASPAGTSGTGSAAEVAATSGQHVYVRVKAAENISFASDWTDCGVVQLGVNDIVLTDVGYDVAAGKLTGTTDNMEYQIDGSWMACTSPDTVGVVFAAGTVKVRQKDKTANEHTVGTIAAAEASNTPTLESKTYNSVTLTPMTGYEYSEDGGIIWQDSNLFSGLSSSTAYSFVARIKATAATLPGTPGTPSKQAGKPTKPVSGNTENKATVDDKGNAKVSLTDKNIIDAISDAKTEAAKKDVNAGDITAVIHVTSGGKNANTVTVNLPKTTQEQVIGNKIANVQLVIDRPDLTIGMNLAAVTELNRQAKVDVQLSATRMDNSKLSGDAKAAVGNRPVYDLKAAYGSSKSVTDFGKGSVSVEIPYTLQKGEIAGNVCAVYVDATGKVTYLTDSSYDAKRGTVVFSTSHFSTYGVAYKVSFNFTDINSHWAKDDILFVSDRSLITSTSATTFSPDGSMTRGMFVTALGRLANADISIYKQSSFTDVKADAYYMGYIEWSVKNNILAGIGGGKFDPDGFVTREQAAVIMDRYTTAIGFKLPEVHAENTFADNDKIGAWAAPSVKRIQMAGIIRGKGNNLYDPQGTATRAEVSAALRRFVELKIFSDTAQGWTKNDSNQWMFFKDGKALTGWKDIGANGNTKRYYFDAYGVMAAGKWLEIDGKWYYFYADGTFAKSTKIDSYEVDENGVRKTR